MPLPENDQTEPVPAAPTVEYLHTMRRVWGRARHRALWTNVGLPGDLAYNYYGISRDRAWHVVAHRDRYELAVTHGVPEASLPEYWLMDAKLAADETGLPYIDLDQRMFSARGVSVLNIEPGELDEIVASKWDYLTRPKGGD